MCAKPELFDHVVALDIKLFIEIQIVPAEVQVLVSIHLLHSNLEWELRSQMPNTLDDVPVLCWCVWMPLEVKAAFKSSIIITSYNNASRSNVV